MSPSEVSARLETAPSVSLSLPAVASNLTVVRQVVTGAAQAAGLGEAAIEDIKVAVTEACTNVVVHAYPDSGGPMEVGIWAEPNGIVVSVVDHGRGLAQHGGPPREGLGLGMGLISALAETVDVTSQPGGGIRVMMSFGLGDSSAGPSDDEELSA